MELGMILTIAWGYYLYRHDKEFSPYIFAEFFDYNNHVRASGLVVPTNDWEPLWQMISIECVSPTEDCRIAYPAMKLDESLRINPFNSSFVPIEKFDKVQGKIVLSTKSACRKEVYLIDTRSKKVHMESSPLPLEELDPETCKGLEKDTRTSFLGSTSDFLKAKRSFKP